MMSCIRPLDVILFVWISHLEHFLYPCSQSPGEGMDGKRNWWARKLCQGVPKTTLNICNDQLSLPIHSSWCTETGAKEGGRAGIELFIYLFILQMEIIRVVDVGDVLWSPVIFQTYVCVFTPETFLREKYIPHFRQLPKASVGQQHVSYEVWSSSRFEKFEQDPDWIRLRHSSEKAATQILH
jgi:hypothetical protein